MRRLCGVESNIERDDIVSDGEFFRVVFKSNGEFDASGYEATYTFIKSEGKTCVLAKQRIRKGPMFNVLYIYIL